jgi:hypothetical protein
MNWRNVARLIRVDMKSGRLIRGQRLTRYRDKKIFFYLEYGGAVALGLIVGGLVGLSYNAYPDQRSLFQSGFLSLSLSLPTLILIYSLVVTMMQQIQRSGVRFSIQAPYWLPITWEEHTLASTLANLLGFLLVSIIFIGSAIVIFSIFAGQVFIAMLTVVALLGSAFTASALTEILRILQVRFIGAVYKSTGRAAVWVRFVGSLLFFIVFYIIYFTLVSGTGSITLIQSVASAQNQAWFVPFVWLGITLYSIVHGMLLQTAIFAMLSTFFILSLYYIAVVLNRRFGLYEPPAITISHGIYVPKSGVLGKFGFTTVEAALIRKDLKAFTRRRELIFIFILPIIMVIVPIMQALGRNGPPSSVAWPFLYFFILLFPGALMATMIGTLMIGEEGAAVWRIYSSPISPQNLVKSKYSFSAFFSILVTLVTEVIGVALFHPSFRASVVGLAESLLLVLALGALSLAIGIVGADFTELPRPRMIRPVWSLINFIICALAGLIVLSPLVPVALSRLAPTFVPSLIDPYYAVLISSVIAFITAFVGYRVALRNARDLLNKAEV